MIIRDLLPGTVLRKPLGTLPDGRVVVRFGVVLGPVDGEPGKALVVWRRLGRRIVVQERVAEVQRWAV